MDDTVAVARPTDNGNGITVKSEPNAADGEGKFSRGRPERYEMLMRLGEGQYATVYQARDAVSAELYAIKKIKLGHAEHVKDGVDRSALREIKILQEISHKNVLRLFDVFELEQNICLVLDFMEGDLEKIIKNKDVPFSAADVKSFLLMTLQGIEFLHSRWILHRDLKPNNLLIDANGVVKISDFGLARCFGSPNRQYTPKVVTVWYRPPELLFGARQYGTGVDIWSIGCIFAELMLRTPFLPGDGEMDQLTKIFSALGTPTEETWPGLTKLPDYVAYRSFPASSFRAMFSGASAEACELIGRMLKFYPPSRCTATDALQHPYFSTEPFPTAPEALPRPPRDSKEKDESRKRAIVDDDAAIGRKVVMRLEF